MHIYFNDGFYIKKWNFHVACYIVSIFAIIFSISSTYYVEASISNSYPFWMPLEFDIGKGYFKVNVFILNLQEDTGLIKICAIALDTDHRLCHYMNAAEEEHQILSPNVSIHAGIFVFPSFQVPVNTNVEICVTTLNNEQTVCKTITNTTDSKEEAVDLTLN